MATPIHAYLSIGSSTRAAPSGLDAEQVVQESTHKVMVQEETTGGVAHKEREYGEPRGVAGSHYHQFLDSFPFRENMATDLLLHSHDDLTSNCLLELHGQPCPHRAHNGWGASLLPQFHFLEVAMS